MSILPHHKYPLRSVSYLNGCCCRHLPARVYCLAATTSSKPGHNHDQLVIGPPQLTPQPTLVGEGAGLKRPKLNDPSLQSTWSHRAWLASGCTTVLVSLAKSAMAAADSHMWLEPILAGLVGYVLADLGSGVYHWGIDNYGGPETPIFGGQIEAFQGHHQWPWTITRRQFANNLSALARAITFVVLPLDFMVNGSVAHAFIGVCSGCIMFSQQFHAWAHGTKSRLPPPVLMLQDAGVLVSRSQHGDHHRPPYNNNYCIVSGVWNEFLDTNKVFEALEMVLFLKLGVRPRSWSEPNSDWTEQTEAESSEMTM